jgi:DNA polymerase-4
MPFSRTIIHVDLDAFYCAVEEQQNPTLAGRAFAVGGRPETRGVVASCSYPARERGVRSAMSMSMALRLCPGLVVVPTRHSLYRSVSHQVMILLRGWTPQLEQLSIDEAFLDVTELLTWKGAPYLEDGTWTPYTLTLRIQRQIREELGLSCSMGVAGNKMVAKIATDYGKAAGSKAASESGTSPSAICVVPAGEEAMFLAPLSVTALWGVGPKMTERLAAQGITTIGELAQRTERDLVRALGRAGYQLSQHARGIDKRQIVTERPSKSISSETTFPQDVADWDTLEATLEEQARDVVKHLQEEQLRCTTVKIKVRWTDFSITSRQITLVDPTADGSDIVKAAGRLLAQLWPDGTPVRLLGVGVSGLSAIRQLSLWEEEASDAISETVETTTNDENVLNKSSIAAPPFRDAARDAKRQQIRRSIALLEARYGAAVVHVAAHLPPRAIE